MNIGRIIKQNLIQLPGWHTHRKIITIESDDWGSIRMPSKKIFKKLLESKDIFVDNPYNRYDTLANSEDLSHLFDVLKSIKDKNGNHAVLTANCVMANPDFKAIKEASFNRYFYETLKETFKRYNNQNALKLWNEGINSSIFHPQFHGREHLNVPFWLKKLKNGHNGVITAFNYGVFGANFSNLGLRKHNLQVAWDFDTKKQNEYIITSIKDGMHLFNKMFGYTSNTVIPPSYTWNSEHEKLLADLGVMQMQGILFQKVPHGFKKKYKKKIRFTRAYDNILGYQMRNVFFEPTLYGHSSQVDNVLNRIKIAFNMNKPAIIGTHRLNYIGVHSDYNRKETLSQLKTILRSIVRKWPDVEFMSASELAKLMRSSH